MIWNVRNRRLECGKRTLCMGILNVTPDSFFDGGRYSDPEAAVEEGRRMFASGADLVDVGGESTRPGSEPVTEAEELNRVIPVVAALSRLPGALVSVDTTKARVAAEAIAAGAEVINDISALRGDPGMAKVAAETGAGVVLMHMLGTPRSMQDNPVYADVVTEVRDFLRERVDAAVAAGIRRDSIVVDPGIGFGKTVEHNLEILGRLREFAGLDRPLLVGPSRKSFIGKVLGGLPPEDRLEGTAAAVVLCIAGGAALVRVHDVAAMVRVIRVADVIRGRTR
jgi:dihydropteroate synthase